MRTSRVRSLAEIGLTIALAAVLQLISVVQMPQGGSYSLTMLPIFVLALLRGPVAGLVAGALYGVVDLWMEPYIFQPVQVLLDYPVAYGLVGLAGLFAGRWARFANTQRPAAGVWGAIVPGIALGAAGRYAAHVLSGIIFFSSYAIELGEHPVIYSLVYNLYVPASALVCAFAAAAVLPPLDSLVRQRSR